MNISASKFEEISDLSNTPSISSFFNKKTKTETTSHASDNQVKSETEIVQKNEKGGELLSVNTAKENSGNAEGEASIILNQYSSTSTAICEAESNTERIENCNDGKIAPYSEHGDNSVSNKKGIDAFFSGSGKNSGEGKQENGELRNPYRDCEIDCTVLESLPEGIRREIKQSLAKSNQSVKRTKEPMNFFGSRALSSAKETTSRSCLNNEAQCVSDSSSDREKRVSGSNQRDSTNLVKCDKCEAKLFEWEMPEHLDYHFALELQKLERDTSASTSSDVSPTKPPKKKQRTTIQSFFTPK